MHLPTFTHPSLSLSILFFLSPLLPVLATAIPTSTPQQPSPSSLPYRTLANISLIDTPIVRAAENYAKIYSPGSYNHVMRTWLLGVLHLRHDPVLAAKVDLEVHAVGLILHDIASDHNLSHPFVSADRRFEVDSAIAAAEFIRSFVFDENNDSNNNTTEEDDGERWPDWRVQRVWDGIALHAEPKLALYKEADVFAIYWGNELDFSFWKEEGKGRERKGITVEEYEGVLREFPREGDQGDGGTGGGCVTGMGTGLLQFIAWYCRYKPESTYSESLSLFLFSLCFFFFLFPFPFSQLPRSSAHKFRGEWKRERERDECEL